MCQIIQKPRVNLEAFFLHVFVEDTDVNSFVLVHWDFHLSVLRYACKL